MKYKHYKPKAKKLPPKVTVLGEPMTVGEFKELIAKMARENRLVKKGK